jgi:hypothetical protein
MLLAASQPSFAKGGGHSHSDAGPMAAPGVARDSRGRIARSPKARASFRYSNPCPSSGKSSGACPGYVIDHVVALKRGGADAPRNMQWQTREAAKAKDRWE